MTATVCDSSSVIPETIALSIIGILFLILTVTSVLYLSKRNELIALYADPRNKIVTFLRPEDFHSGRHDEKRETSSRRRKTSHRDVLAEAKRIEEGRGSEDSIPRRKSVDGAGALGSVIYSKDTDPTNPANFIKYEWEIPFSEIKLHARIGGGQYGDVYTGEWLDTDVAVKCPRSDLGNEELAVFLREVKIMSKIHHPNIVLFLGSCLIMPNICLVMEYLAGGNLFDYLNAPRAPHSGTIVEESLGLDESSSMNNSNHEAKGASSDKIASDKAPVKAPVTPLTVGISDGTAGKRMDEDEIDFFESTRFAIDIARGMKYLHDRAKVVQRDLKSKNLLIDSTMTIKICDFGLSRLEGRGSHNSSMKELGTPYWLAPEVIRKESSGTKANVYSFAIVLWEIFTHEVPHKELTGLEVAYAVAHKGLRPEIKSGTPAVISMLMRRCWKSDPKHRPDFSEILDLLLNEQTKMETGELGRASGGNSIDTYNSVGPRNRGMPPLNSPLATFMLSGQTPFFGGGGGASGGSRGGSQQYSGGKAGIGEDEMRKIAAARMSGRRASLGSIGTATKTHMIGCEAKERNGGSLEYPTRRSRDVGRAGSKVYDKMLFEKGPPEVEDSDNTPKMENKKQSKNTAKVAPIGGV